MGCLHTTGGLNGGYFLPTDAQNKITTAPLSCCICELTENDRTGFCSLNFNADGHGQWANCSICSDSMNIFYFERVRGHTFPTVFPIFQDAFFFFTIIFSHVFFKKESNLL